MKTTAIVAIVLVVATLPAHAIDFLGVELCKGSVDTRVQLRPGSSLVLESVEIGDHGGLVMLLSARSGKVMRSVDDLMTGLTGERGKGDADSLEWSDGRLTGVAQRVAKKYVALAVTSTDNCPGADPAPVPVPTEAVVGAVAATTSAEPPQPVEAEIVRLEQRLEELICLVVVTVDEPAVHAQERVGGEECDSLVSIHERMIHREALHQRRGLVDEGIVVSELRPHESRLERSQVANAVGTAELCE